MLINYFFRKLKVKNMNKWEEISDWDYTNLEDLYDFVDKKFFDVIKEAIDVCPCTKEISVFTDEDNRIVYFILDDSTPFKLLKTHFDSNGEIDETYVIDDVDKQIEDAYYEYIDENFF